MRMYVPLHMVFTYWDKSSILHHSFQLLSGSHWDGFGWGLSSPIPPVSRNLQSSSLTSFLCFIRFTHNMKEKRSCTEEENTWWHLCYIQVEYTVRTSITYRCIGKEHIVTSTLCMYVYKCMYISTIHIWKLSPGVENIYWLCTNSLV